MALAFLNISKKNKDGVLKNIDNENYLGLAGGNPGRAGCRIDPVESRGNGVLVSAAWRLRGVGAGVGEEARGDNDYGCK